MIKNYRIKKYWVLVKKSIESRDKLFALKNKLYFNSNDLFVERLQPTKGFLKAEVQDYIEPKDWKNTEPCVVTVYRHGVEEAWGDQIYNVGSDVDVKEFCCPHFQENMQCTQDCRYKHKYNEYLELKNRLIPEAEKAHESLVALRKAAWKQMFARRTK